MFGATEVGPVANPFYGYDADPNDPDAKTTADWQWHKMPPNTCPRWDPQGGGVFELQFLVRLSYSRCVRFVDRVNCADHRRAPTERREFTRREGLRDFGSMGAAPDQEGPMAYVSDTFLSKLNIY